MGRHPEGSAVILVWRRDVKDWFKLHPFHDYASALAHLEQRSPQVRRDAPLAHAVRLVVDLVEPGSASVVYHQTPIVTYWPNGTTTLHWGGWFTKTTFAHIERYARLGDLRLGVRNPDKHRRGDGAEYWMTTWNWNRTPSRITKCRTCKGAGRRASVYVPEGFSECYHCNGRGEIERGNQPVRLELEPHELLVICASGMVSTSNDTMPSYHCKCDLCGCNSCDGSWQEHWMCEKAGKQTKAALVLGVDLDAQHTSTTEMGSEVADELAALIPAMASYVTCPACKHEARSPLRERIVHLNDDHQWTREAVADWLDTLDLDLKFPIPA